MLGTPGVGTGPDFAAFMRANDAASITCVRCGGGFAGVAAGAFDAAIEPGGDDPDRGPPSAPGFERLGMSCVPGAFFAGGAAPAAPAAPAIGGGGLVPVRPPVGSERLLDARALCPLAAPGPVFAELGALGGILSPAAFWNAPRCESALLTASGDTGGMGAVPSPGGGPDGGFDVVAGGGP